jgi:hypothetical protein
MKDKVLKTEITNKAIEKIHIAEQGKQQLIDFLLQGAEKLVENKFSNENLDREKEIIHLLGGGQISIYKIKSFIADCQQKYVKTFPLAFYSEIDRLNNWTRPKEKINQKPPIVGRWTKQIIYGRFPKEVLQALEQLNPYIGFGLRMHKHFQWLTKESKDLLIEYIEESISLMKTSTTWYEFRVKYASKYGVAFQLSVFADNDKIVKS